MTDYSTWKVGDKVVCVDAVFVGGFDTGLKLGKVYTITATHAPMFGEYRGQFGRQLTISVDGATSFTFDGKPHPKLNVLRFRRVVPRKTDISVFTAMLNTDKVDA